MDKLLWTITLAFCFSCTQQHSVNDLSPEAFESMLQKNPDAQLVDVRTPEEFQSGYIAGAKNLNIYDADFAQQIAQLDKNKPVMVYCAKGGRSATAAEQLKQAGFLQVYDLSGGMMAWKTAGKQTVQ